MLLSQGCKANARHEGRDEAVVIDHLPANILHHTLLQGCDTLARRGRDLGLSNGNWRRSGDAFDGCLVWLPCRGSDGLLESSACSYREDTLRNQTSLEEEAGNVTKGGGTDETRRSEKDQISDQARKGVGKVHGNATTKGVADETEGSGASPGQGARSQGEEHLGDVEAGVMGEVSHTI